MAIAYYGIKLSPNMAERSDGALICKNAVIARTGWQSYKGKELDEDNIAQLGLTIAPEDDVALFRSPDEVFSKATMGSFEGVPVTDAHPDSLITIETIKEHQRGHIQNVRKGTELLESGDQALLADLFITDPILISKINSGLRELSCGYNYSIIQIGDALWQVDIIGNHVALVPVGRAGKEASIKDASPNLNVRNYDMSNILKTLLGLGFQQFAKDAKPEEVATAIEEMSKPGPKLVAKDAHIEGCKCTDCIPATGKDAVKGAANDSDDRERMHNALDRVMDGKEAEQNAQDADIDSLKKMFATDAEADDAEEDEDDEEGNDETSEEMEETEATDDGEFISPEDRPKPGVPSAVDKAYKKGLKDGGLEVIKALKPAIASSKNTKLIKAFDSASKVVKGVKSGKGSYNDFNAAATTPGKAAKAAMDSHEDRIAKGVSEANAAYKAMKGKPYKQA